MLCNMFYVKHRKLCDINTSKEKGIKVACMPYVFPSTQLLSRHETLVSRGSMKVRTFMSKGIEQEEEDPAYHLADIRENKDARTSTL